MSRRLRIQIGLGLVVLLGVVYAWQFGMQTADALLVHYKFRRLPDVSQIPVPLHDLAISKETHTKASCSGFDYELPWDDIDSARNKKVGTICVTTFRSGNAFWFSTFPANDFVTGLQHEMHMSPEQFRRHVGESTSDSDYGFMEQMLNARPSEVSVTASPNAADFFLWLLIVKATTVPPADSGIYAIRLRGYRGFQFENRKAPRFQIEDDLYNDSGGIEVILFFKDRQSAANITQPQINRILDSIHQSNEHQHPLTTD